MLPADSRVRHRAEFTAITRRGSSAAAGPVVVHVLGPDPAAGRTRAGFVVGRQVGSAVHRNQVRRRLRHLMATRLTHLPEGSLVVVRARPGAAAAGFEETGRALDTALSRALSRAPSSPPRGALR